MVPYKGRTVNRFKPVRVYRNLTRGGYSILQDGVVVAHADAITLKECKFLVNESGRQRVIREKRKNVHAFVSGLLVGTGPREVFGVTISYNPYEADQFQTEEGTPVVAADVVHLNKRGVTARNAWA